jgi:maltose alpha-D-glucosyltransferase/alpha-amylase
MFALPGTPVIWYGEEIGMGEDLSLPEREPVRTPMQWSDEPNAGFSTAPPERLVRPVVSDGPFGYRSVNVMAQRDTPGALLEHVQRLVRARRACPEIGWGECTVLDSGAPGVLALRHEWRGNVLVTLHNLSDRPARLRLDLGEGRLVPVIWHAEVPEHPAGDPLKLEGHDFRWFRLRGERR